MKFKPAGWQTKCNALCVDGIPLKRGSLSMMQKSYLVAVILIIIVGGYSFFISSFKRVHDLGLSGWWLFLGLIPVVNFIGSLALLGWRGDVEENKFGSVPLAFPRFSAASFKDYLKYFGFLFKPNGRIGRFQFVLIKCIVASFFLLIAAGTLILGKFEGNEKAELLQGVWTANLGQNTFVRFEIRDHKIRGWATCVFKDQGFEVLLGETQFYIQGEMIHLNHELKAGRLLPAGVGATQCGVTFPAANYLFEYANDQFKLTQDNITFARVSQR